ncbi:MAG: molybdopterin-dependent oxidoreductase [Verrucomicrobia bacterium]|nr:molybdopterin-dependent oxidoreductase [Verrucomicrobiota bacterium]
MIQACKAAGVKVPHYCYHRDLPVAGNCRMCLVEFGTPALGPDRKPIIETDGTPRINRSPRPVIACATPVSPGMEIYTDTPKVRKMRREVLEFLLINHPLDCPICDQAGECKLQEYSVEYGDANSRFVENKEHKPKQVELGPRIILDDERCILCTRCIRFTRDIVGDDALGIINRGGRSTLTNYPGRPFDNNYTLNTVDICPVGALTSKDFRFRMRVWFLKETPSICAGCGTGCNMIIGSRENKIYRFTPRRNDAVNKSWMCDYGRLNFKWIESKERLNRVVVRDGRGREEISDWASALGSLVARLKTLPHGVSGVIGSAGLSVEELFLLKMLSNWLGGVTDSVPNIGEEDNLLVSADKNPNSKGAELTGVAAKPMGSEIKHMAGRIKDGTLKALFVFGEDVTEHGIVPELLDKLELLVVADVLPNSTSNAAHYLFPGAAYVEKKGTFLNVRGRAQRFFKAVEPPGSAHAEFELLVELLRLLRITVDNNTVEGVFERFISELDESSDLTWDGLGDDGVDMTGRTDAGGSG